MANRAIIAEFHKSAGKRLTLFSVTVIEEGADADGREWRMRRFYDVERSRRLGCYLWDESGCGGGGTVPVSGPYFVSGEVEVREEPTSLVDTNDRAPWRSRKTKAIRQRNRTRRLRALPKEFDLKPGEDLVDWLEQHAIQQDAVWCSVCRDNFPSDELCEHCWWCDLTCWYSTPSERCECASREQCDGKIVAPEAA